MDFLKFLQFLEPCYSRLIIFFAQQVRQEEEAVHGNEPSAGPETADIINNSSAELTQNNPPKQGGIAGETSQLGNVVYKDRSDGKKEFLKHSETTRTRQHSEHKTRNRSSEDKSDHCGKRIDRKRQFTNNRSKTSEMRLKKKEPVKPSENLGGGFALWNEDKSESSQTRLETEVNTPSDNLEKAVTNVSNGSRNSGSSQNFHGEKPRSARRGRGKSSGGRFSTASTPGTTEGGGTANTHETSSGEVVGKLSEGAAPSESGKAKPEKKSVDQQLEENRSDKRKQTNGKHKVRKSPPGFENFKTMKEDACKPQIIIDPSVV